MHILTISSESSRQARALMASGDYSELLSRASHTRGVRVLLYCAMLLAFAAGGVPPLPTSASPDVSPGKFILLVDQVYRTRPFSQFPERLFMVGGHHAQLFTSLGVFGLPDLSPDGKQLAVGAQDGVYVLPPSGGRPHRIIRSPTRCDPGEMAVGPTSWSPTGDGVAYGVFLNTDAIPPCAQSETGVWVDTPATNGPRRLTTGDLASGSFSWSPDGKEGIVSADLGSQPVVAAVDIGTGNGHVLIQSAYQGSANPVTGRLTYETEPAKAGGVSTVWVADSSGGNRTSVASTHSWVDWLSWSPDGRLVAYQTYSRGTKKHPHLTTKLWIVDPTNAEPRLLVSSKGKLDGPVWSPTSTAIAYLGGPQKDGYRSTLHVISVRGTDAHVVFQAASPQSGLGAHDVIDGFEWLAL